MTTIRVKENEPFDVALRRFKRTIEKLGLLTDLRAREFYEKPTAERKRKKAAAVKRHFKRVRSMQLPKKLLLSPPRAVASEARDTRASSFRLPRTFSSASIAMSLKDRITEDMKTAMRAKDAPRLLTIRGLLAALKQREVDERIVLDDAAVVAIVDKLVKQRKDSIEQFTAGGRQDLVDKEAAELHGAREPTCRSAWAPTRSPPRSPRIVAELGAAGPGDMGKVMAAAKARLAGRPTWRWSRPPSRRRCAK